jgi:hypothetical protein
MKNKFLLVKTCYFNFYKINIQNTIQYKKQKLFNQLNIFSSWLTKKRSYHNIKCFINMCLVICINVFYENILTKYFFIFNITY